MTGEVRRLERRETGMPLAVALRRRVIASTAVLRGPGRHATAEPRESIPAFDEAFDFDQTPAFEAD